MKQIIGDSHLHTVESDGACSINQVIELAIERGLSYMCFTDHYPLPAQLGGNEIPGFSADYLSQIRQARKLYAGRIDICLGGEFDWIEHYCDWTAAQIESENYDYILGSIHNLFDRNCDLCFVDNGPDNFHKMIAALGSIEKTVCQYYCQLRMMINSGLFDGVGHLDIIKIYNADDCFFSEQSDWYKDQITQTLDALAKSNMCMEINTNGWYKTCATQYPSLWILTLARQRNIPITLSSDGHKPESIGRDLTKAAQLAKSVGYTSFVRFKNRKMLTCPII